MDTNIGIYYYVALSLFSIIVYYILPKITTYLSNVLLFYTVIVIFCYTIYTSESESLQPTGLIFVLALVAGLNHSYIYITIVMILVSVMMNIFFSFLTETDYEQLSTYVSTFNTFVRIFSSLVWSGYVYIQELEKKTQTIKELSLNQQQIEQENTNLGHQLYVLKTKFTDGSGENGKLALTSDEEKIDRIQKDQMVQLLKRNHDVLLEKYELFRARNESLEKLAVVRNLPKFGLRWPYKMFGRPYFGDDGSVK